MLLTLASPAYVLWPAGQVEQTWIIAKGETPFSLTAALFGQANLALAAQVSGTLIDQAPL
ncbi:hypothetical protein D3C77_712000 [compost metagenome]